jgi:parallel beta-helix repeat protein
MIKKPIFSDKTLVFGIILLLLGICSNQSFGIIIERESNIIIRNGNTLYVGGLGPDNYTKIQDALDESNNGDTVYVFADSSPYYENLIVDNSINLFGESKEFTIIDGSEKEETDVILVKANKVTIQGFTIQNGTHRDRTGIGVGVKVLAHNIIIKDNIITDNMDGIQLGKVIDYYANNSLIEANKIVENHEFGVKIDFSSDNVISKNIISSNRYHGIFLCWQTGNNLVTYNNISFHEQVGIWVLSTNNNSINYNIITENGEGVLIDSSSQNKVLENNIYNNEINARVSGEPLGLILYRWLDNYWDANYWGRYRLLPKPIPVTCNLILPNFIWMFFIDWFPLFIPLVVFDLHPAKEPYDI